MCAEARHRLWRAHLAGARATVLRALRYDVDQRDDHYRWHCTQKMSMAYGHWHGMFLGGGFENVEEVGSSGIDEVD